MEECIHPTLGMRVRSDGSVFVKGRWPSTSHWTKGTPICNGYRGLTICRHMYLVHRIVYEAFFGQIPAGYEIDHIDRDPANNAISNLRVCTHAENMRNTVHADRCEKTRGIHKWEDPVAWHAAYHQVYKNTDRGLKMIQMNRKRQDLRRHLHFRVVHLSNGKRGWLPTAIALDFRKLPKVERTPELYQKLKQEGKHAQVSNCN